MPIAIVTQHRYAPFCTCASCEAERRWARCRSAVRVPPAVVAMRYERLMAEGREADADTVWDDPAPGT